MKIFTPEEWNAKEAARRGNAARTRCTKYQLVQCLTEHFPDLLATLRAAYAQNADLQFYWNSVLDLDRNNADFQAAIQALGITEEQLTAVFAKIKGEEPAGAAGK